MNVDIIIPCFNEDKNIEKLVQLWSEVTKRNENFYIYYVENGSDDDTRENLKKYIKLYHPKRTNVLLVDKNIGYGHGIMSGVNISNGEYTTRNIISVTPSNVEDNPTRLAQELQYSINNGYFRCKGCFCCKYCWNIRSY